MNADKKEEEGRNGGMERDFVVAWNCGKKYVSLIMYYLIF